MKKMMLWIIALIALTGCALRAQDLAGNWQGTLHTSNKDLRIIVAVSKDDGKLRASMYSIDQGGQPFKATSVRLDGSAFKMSIESVGATYEGKLSADGNAIAGTWTQGSPPLELDLVRATKETAWEIPPPPAPPKLMAADADPSFDVATIKPNDTGATSMQGLTIRGRNFATRASSLGDLISFAYGVQSKQVIGGPDWLDKDRYDIAAVPVEEGAPNPAQLKVMIQKLIEDRFQLKFHHEKRDLSAFVLTVGKTGQKLTPTQGNGPLPGLFFSPGKGGVALHVMNGTMADFTGFLQILVLDRPVVDQTSLTGKYDFNFIFSPDDSQFHGHPPPMPKQADDAEAAPGLFDAIQQSLGLRLAAEKAPVDVIVIDHVEKPSAN
jgi:uncharacterized protein (TIGR03435 family)